MDALGVENISGHHGKAYNDWQLSNTLSSNEHFMKHFLGEELYPVYYKLQGTTIRFESREHQAQAFVLRLLISLPALGEESFKQWEITVSKLWNKENELAAESDDEDKSQEPSVLPSEEKKEAVIDEGLPGAQVAIPLPPKQIQQSQAKE
jgi:hypothetical protein